MRQLGSERIVGHSEAIQVDALNRQA
jgi:hypothetical protein